MVRQCQVDDVGRFARGLLRQLATLETGQYVLGSIARYAEIDYFVASPRDGGHLVRQAFRVFDSCPERDGVGKEEYAALVWMQLRWWYSAMAVCVKGCRSLNK